MDLPNYQHKIAVYCQDRDYYGFLEEEGEAYILDGVLITNIRYNDRNTGQKGAYKEQRFPILEYFEEIASLKVLCRPKVAGLFNLERGTFAQGIEYLRFVKDDFAESNEEDLNAGRGFILEHLRYLYQLELEEKALDWTSKILKLTDGEALEFGGLHIYKEHKTYHFQKEKSPFLMTVRLFPKGFIFTYVYISYYFEGLKAYLNKMGRDAEWSIA